MLTSAFWRALLPVRTGTRLIDTVDFVPVPGRGLHHVATTVREERDVHCFLDSTRRPWLKVVLRLCVLVDDMPVAEVASPSTVRTDGFCRASEPLVQTVLDRIAFQPKIIALRGARDGQRCHTRPRSRSRLARHPAHPSRRQCSVGRSGNRSSRTPEIGYRHPAVVLSPTSLRWSPSCRTSRHRCHSRQ
jgi:hypothetical protein